MDHMKINQNEHVQDDVSNVFYGSPLRVMNVGEHIYKIIDDPMNKERKPKWETLFKEDS